MFVLIYYIIWFIILFAHKSGTPSRGFSNQPTNSYFSRTFLQIPTSPTFYLSYLMDTLAYWVVQQHKRFISTNTHSFNLHLAYRSPDHYYNIFFTNELKRSWLSRCSTAYSKSEVFQICLLSKSVEIDLIFTWKRNFSKIDYFLRYFAIPT